MVDVGEDGGLNVCVELLDKLIGQQQQSFLKLMAKCIRASTLCTVLGVLTHFLWLWNFTWSFICSYHMFRVFACNLRRSSTVQPRKLWITVICSILFPIIIIVTTVVFNFLKFDGQNIGYGLSVCYLNTAFLVGVTMIGPMAVVTLLNLLFFAITVYKIHKVQKMQSSLRRTDQNNYLFSYIRLSSVTGAFWTVAIFATSIDSVLL
uniref:G-protein coupled receptors family 2 profile 2 domain-containing protein n=1 Tax=Biomphalaria glabrata TaxID=6526 RepID=A0A2C9LGT5_BIOGL